jgi:hypothetical protein
MVPFTINEPPRPEHLPSHAQWLAGKNSGCWFSIEKSDLADLHFIICCYNQDTHLSSKGLYKVDHPGFTLDQDYHFTHLSHYKYCSIKQHNKLYRFSLVQKENKDSIVMEPDDIKRN